MSEYPLVNSVFQRLLSPTSFVSYSKSAYKAGMCVVICAKRWVPHTKEGLTYPSRASDTIFEFFRNSWCSVFSFPCWSLCTAVISLFVFLVGFLNCKVSLLKSHKFYYFFGIFLLSLYVYCYNINVQLIIRIQCLSFESGVFHYFSFCFRFKLCFSRDIYMRSAKFNNKHRQRKDVKTIFAYMGDHE